MTTPATRPAADLVSAIREVPGVRAAEGEPSGAVRIDLVADAQAEAVERAVSALLWARGISGATTEAVERMGPVGADGRLLVDELVLRERAGSVSAEVTLRLEDLTATGTAEESNGRAAVVGAILLALEELTEDAVIGSVESARVDSDGIARVRLRLDVDGVETEAEAEAAVLRSEPQAVVRAILTAVEPHLPS